MLATSIVIDEIKKMSMKIINEDDIEKRKEFFKELVKILCGRVLSNKFVNQYFFKSNKEVNARICYIYSLAKIANEYIEIGGIFGKALYKGREYYGIQYGKIFWMPSQSMEGKEVIRYAFLERIYEEEFMKIFNKNAMLILFR